MSAPFILYALPRSRTAWLSKFLTYGEWFCHHERAIEMRSMGEVKSFFNRPNTGTVETAAAQGRALIRHAIPNIKEVVILRPVNEVVNAMMRIDVSGVATYNRDILQRNMEYGDRELRKIAQDKNVLVVNYDDLKNPETCAMIFEHCLPYKFNIKWWESLKDTNIQVDVKSILKYYQKNRDAVEAFKKHCKRELIKLCRLGEIRKVRV